MKYTLKNGLDLKDFDSLKPVKMVKFVTTVSKSMQYCLDQIEAFDDRKKLGGDVLHNIKEELQKYKDGVEI